MRLSRAILALPVLLALPLAALAFTSCEAPAVCGDGVVGRGESEATCCQDTGCRFGRCDEGSRRCFDPWLLTCEGAGVCLGDGPYRCQNPAPPAYDCAACDCPDGGRCEAGVCWTADELTQRRDDDEVSTSLDVEQYFALVEELLRAPLTLDELVGEVQRHARRDRRHSYVLFGSGSSSEREALLREELLRRLDDAIGLDASGGTLVPAGEPHDAACDELYERARQELADERVRYAAGPADAVHRETCFHEELWPRCGPPTLAGCVTRAGRLPLTLLLVDFAQLLDVVDRALLIRSTNRPAGERQLHLDQAISRWRQTVDTWPAPEEYAVDLAGQPLVVRGQRSARYPDTWWLSLPARAKAPWGLLGFRLLWGDAATNAYLSEHDLVGRDCSWTVTSSEVRYVCADDAAEVSAVLDVATQSLLSVERGPP